MWGSRQIQHQQINLMLFNKEWGIAFSIGYNNKRESWTTYYIYVK